MKKEVTTDIILETRKPRKKEDPNDVDRYPVKLRVTFKRKYKVYTCFYTPEDAQIEPLWNPGESIIMTKEEYRRTFTERPRDEYRLKNAYLDKLQATAEDVIRSLGSRFSLEAFGKKYLTKQGDANNLFTGLRATAKELRESGRISYAGLYDFTADSFEKFNKGRPLPYEDITPTLLNKYQKWMQTERTEIIKVKDKKDKEKKIKPNSLTTIGMYLRNVRTEYRKAEDNGIFKGGSYPFGKGKYRIPGSRNVKKALQQKEVALIANYKAIPGTIEQQHRDYWLFSYLCNGINIKDLARLKNSNIDGDTITLIRAKTARETQSDPKPVVIMITRQIGRIIDRWGVKPALPDQYIFPILQDGMTAEKEYKTILQTIRDINKSMKGIAKALKLPQKVTTYVARHSFATVLKRSGASTEFISESLGHHNVKTTADYLASFEHDVKREWAEKLLPETNE